SAPTAVKSGSPGSSRCAGARSWPVAAGGATGGPRCTWASPDLVTRSSSNPVVDSTRQLPNGSASSVSTAVVAAAPVRLRVVGRWPSEVTTCSAGPCLRVTGRRSARTTEGCWPRRRPAATARTSPGPSSLTRTSASAAGSGSGMAARAGAQLAGLAYGQVPEILPGQAGVTPGPDRPRHRLWHRLGREHERAPVHGRHPPRAQVLAGAYRLLRVHVHGPHEPPGRVRPDRHQRQIDAGVAGADPAEPVPVAGVSGEVDPGALPTGAGAGQDPATP